MAFANVNIYLHTKCRQDIPIRSWVITTFDFWNDLPKYWNYASGFNYDLFIVIAFNFPRQFHPNQTTHDGVMTTYRYNSLKSTYGVGSSDGTHLGMWTSIFTPNFDKISQSAHKLLLLAVCENIRPSLCNCTCDVDFGLYAVIIMCQPVNFVQIDRCTDNLLLQRA